MFGPANLINGIARPTRQPNAWVAAWDDPHPTLELAWPAPQRIGRIELVFDTDYDHPMESVLMEHPERVIPFCVCRFEIRDAGGRPLFECRENHQSRRSVCLNPPVTTERLTLAVAAPSQQVPAALIEIRCYAD